MAATLTTALTGEEITILKSYKRSRFSLVQHKAEALLLLEDGVTLDIIAKDLGVSRATFYRALAEEK